MTRPSPRYASLLGIRNALIGLGNQVDALIMQEEIDLEIELDEARPDPEGCPNCGASGDDQKPVNTLDGTLRRHCGRCGDTWVFRQPQPIEE